MLASLKHQWSDSERKRRPGRTAIQRGVSILDFPTKGRTVAQGMRDFSGDTVPWDLHSHHRFPIVTDLQYKLLAGATPVIGSGRTMNMSSRDVLIESNEPLPHRAPIELALAWPVKVSSNVGLKLVVFGRVVRTQGNFAAVRFWPYEFRSRRAGKLKESLRGW